MTVAENILLGAFPTRFGFTRYKDLKEIAANALAEIGVSVDLDERVSRLSVALRQFVEIARAVARQPKVLILDEPTATLTPAETDYLLRMLSRLAEGGMAIAYISHRIPEVFEISSNVTILRDGRQVLTAPIAALTPQEVIDNMVGRELKEDLQTHRDATPGEVVLRATDIEAPRVSSVSLEVRAGEIVGLGGLVGAGRSELVRAIIGADNRTAGRVTLTQNGRSVTLSSYTSAVRNGVGYVPGRAPHRRPRLDHDRVGQHPTAQPPATLSLRHQGSAEDRGVRPGTRRQSGAAAAGDRAGGRAIQRWQPAKSRLGEVAGAPTGLHGSR